MVSRGSNHLPGIQIKGKLQLRGRDSAQEEGSDAEDLIPTRLLCQRTGLTNPTACEVAEDSFYGTVPSC